MIRNKRNDRRAFLRSAGTALVAASVPATIVAGPGASGLGQNNLKQIIVFGGVSEPLPDVPGVFGQVSLQLQMTADIGVGGWGTFSDSVFNEVNSQFRIDYAARSGASRFAYRGTIIASRTTDMIGKRISIQQVQDTIDTCDLFLTIEDTPVASLLLPAIMKVRDKNGL